MQSSYGLPIPQPDPLAEISSALSAELGDLFQIASTDARSRGQVISFSGRFTADPERSYDEVRRRFRRHGYTPMFRREKDKDVIVAMEGLADRAKTGSPLVNLALLLATIFTTLAAGAAMSGVDLVKTILSGSPAATFQGILAGAPFAVALLGILGVHELGHYLAAQAHSVRATLPYFIPMPVGGFGTLGAFIAIKSPMKDRKVLFDIGLAGPYAGLMVALPLLVIGLLLSTSYVPRGFPSIWTLDTLGSSVLVGFAADLLTDAPVNRTLLLHPIARAAWLGLFLTGINLLPVGQLDGGHAAYALLGRLAHPLAFAIFGLLIIAGAFLSTNWFIWAFFIMLGGLQHPPPMNDVTDVGWVRKLIGLLTVLLFLLIVIPVPFR